VESLEASKKRVFPVHHVPEEGHVVLLRSRNIHSALHLYEKLVGVPCVGELRGEAVHILGDFRDEGLNPTIDCGLAEVHIEMVIESAGYLSERKPREIEVKRESNRFAGIVDLLDEGVAELRLTIVALPSLVPVVRPEPNHSDGATLHALGRVLREDLGLWGLLQLDARGNPELDREGVLAHLYLVCAVLKVRTGADPRGPDDLDFVRKVARLRGNAEATVCVLGDSSFLRDCHASRHPSVRQVCVGHTNAHHNPYTMHNIRTMI
jgi:hypothetical protein